MKQRLIKLPEVCARVALSRAGIYSKVKDGTFPKQVSQGARAVAWLESDIEAWIEARIEAARKHEIVEQPFPAATVSNSGEAFLPSALIHPTASKLARQWGMRKSAITRGRD